VEITQHGDGDNTMGTVREPIGPADYSTTVVEATSTPVTTLTSTALAVIRPTSTLITYTPEHMAITDDDTQTNEFHDARDFMMGWLGDGLIRLDEMPKEKEIGEKQSTYDSTMKTEKGLIGKAPKTDEPIIKNMMTELKNKWNNLCKWSVERQRKLEEVLLLSGQFKDALKELMDWPGQMEKALNDKMPVHGNLDNVMGLVEQLKQTAKELLLTAKYEDAVKIRAQVTELTNRWENVWDPNKNKNCQHHAQNDFNQYLYSFKTVYSVTKGSYHYVDILPQPRGSNDHDIFGEFHQICLVLAIHSQHEVVSNRALSLQEKTDSSIKMAKVTMEYWDCYEGLGLCLCCSFNKRMNNRGC
jgi:hypothetical protein